MKAKSEADREICCQGDKDIDNIVICQDTNLFYDILHINIFYIFKSF